MIKFFEYEDIDGDDIKLEVNTETFKVIAWASLYNFKGGVFSKNKVLGCWVAKNKNKLLKILKNNINTSGMSEETLKKYNKFVKDFDE